MFLLSLQPMLLPFHVFNHNIINISKGGAVFKYLPWRVGVEVDFDERFISDRQAGNRLQCLQ